MLCENVITTIMYNAFLTVILKYLLKHTIIYVSENIFNITFIKITLFFYWKMYWYSGVKIKISRSKILYKSSGIRDYFSALVHIPKLEAWRQLDKRRLRSTWLWHFNPICLRIYHFAENSNKHLVIEVLIFENFKKYFSHSRKKYNEISITFFK